MIKLTNEHQSHNNQPNIIRTGREQSDWMSHSDSAVCGLTFYGCRSKWYLGRKGEILAGVEHFLEPCHSDMNDLLLYALLSRRTHLVVLSFCVICYRRCHWIFINITTNDLNIAQPNWVSWLMNFDIIIGFIYKRVTGTQNIINYSDWGSDVVGLNCRAWCVRCRGLNTWWKLIYNVELLIISFMHTLWCIFAVLCDGLLKLNQQMSFNWFFFLLLA